MNEYIAKDTSPFGDTKEAHTIFKSNSANTMVEKSFVSSPEQIYLSIEKLKAMEKAINTP